MNSPHNDALAATLADLPEDVRQTIERNPRATIEPDRIRMDSTIRAAMRVLSRVSLSNELLGPGTIRVDRTLGEGGMGVVRLGTQPSLARSVAVKSLKQDLRTDSASLRLLREAWITGSLEHPNIVPVYDLAVDERDGPVIVLKRIEGTEWNQLMFDAAEIRRRFRADDPLEWNLGVLIQVCNAVHFAHSRGVIHRDLKPENVMIGNFGEVYLLDWGIAVSMNHDPEGRLPSVQDATQLAGTMCYMAPEMLGEDPPRISPKTDVYLLGAVLFEIVTCRPPHDGTTVLEMMSGALMSDPKFPDETDSEIERIVRRAMAREPDARFESAEQFRLALSGFLRHRGSRRLAHEAMERWNELEQFLKRPDAGDPTVRADIHHIFGECQFGLQQSIASWPENEEAQSALERAVIVMARFELAHGDPSVAARMLEQASGAPSELRDEIGRAELAHRNERARLEQIARDTDNTVGRRTRLTLSLMLGTMWTVMPLLMSRVPVRFQTRLGHILLPVLLAIPVAALGWWARDTMSRTAPNRILRRIVAATLVSQFILQIGLAFSGVGLDGSMALNFVVWGWGSAAAAIAIERWFWLATAGYVAGFFVAMRFPAIRYFAASATHLIMLMSAARAWRLSREEWREIAAIQRERFSRIDGPAWPMRRGAAKRDSADEQGPADESPG